MGWRQAASAVVWCVLVGTLCTCVPAAERSADELIRRAKKMARHGDYARAWVYAEQAVARRPNDPEVRALADAFQRRGMQALSARIPLHAVPTYSQEDVQPTLPEVNAEDRAELRSPPELQPDNVRHSFDLRARPRELIEKVAGAYGIGTVFDYDYPPSGEEQRFHLENVPWYEAIYALQMVTNSFYAPIGARMAIFAKETSIKRGEVEPSVAIALPFPEAMSATELQEVANAVRQAFALTKVALDSNQRMMVLRDRLSRVRPAVELARQLLAGPAEVMVDVELLSVDSSSDVSRGLKLQTNFPIVDFASKAGLPLNPPAPPTGYNFYSVGGGTTFLGVGISDTTFLDTLTGQSAHSITRATVRSINGQPSSLHIGDRYPIIQQSWGSTTAGDASGYAVTPSITFEDLGVVLKLTPRVHDAQSLTLEFDSEYKVLSGNTNDDIPIISNRKFTTQVRMKFGESAVIAGLVQDSVSRTDSGLPGLTWVPLLHSQTESRKHELFLLVLRPQLLRLPPSEMASYGVWSGTEVRGLPFEFKDRAAENPTNGIR